MRQADAPAAARVSAAGILLDRGWGKPLQPHSGGDNDGNLTVVIRRLVDSDNEQPLLLEHEAPKK